MRERATPSRVPDDTIGVKVAVEFVLASPSSHTEEKEDYNGDTANATNNGANDDSDVRITVARGCWADCGGDDGWKGGSDIDD